MNNIMSGFINEFSKTLIQMLVFLIVGVLYTFFLKILAKKKGAKDVLVIGLQMGKSLIISRFGVQGEKIFNAVIAGMQSLDDNILEKQEIVQYLTQFVQATIPDTFAQENTEHIRGIITSIVDVFYTENTDKKIQAQSLSIMSKGA